MIENIKGKRLEKEFEMFNLTIRRASYRGKFKIFFLWKRKERLRVNVEHGRMMVPNA